MATNRRVLLKSRPEGEPTHANFDVVDQPIPEPKDGEYLSRTIWMSLDPYMRGRMAETKGYAANVNLGDAMVGGTVGQVVKSNNPRFKEGDFVAEYSGWQSYAVSNGMMSMKLDPTVAPLSTALSVLGMPGMTAWWGLMMIGKPKAGETVVVSAASGAVGSVVGQLAKLQAAARSASPAARPSATTSWASWASTPASTTAPPAPTYSRSCAPPRPRASTSISRMSAARCRPPSCPSSTTSPACRCAA